MFKKLKDKIADQLEQSPARFQEIINSAQAAVSSTSLNNFESSSNLFGIDSESPLPNEQIAHFSSQALGSISVDLHAPSSSSTPNTSLTNGIQQRKLSNSSMLSDVSSFRLPSYESSIFHLQSDWESASEQEPDDSQAYRTDLAQKYRKKFTNLAVKYKSLEQDNKTARQVLVETQDKALRRISELREQCSLEQQAKAHLESALRLEIEEREIVIKTLRTKTELLGENHDKILNGSSSLSLINLSSEEDTSNEQNNFIVSLEKELKIWKDKFSVETNKCQLNEKLVDELRNEITKLQAQEDTIAENKMTIHSELEKKESEAIKLREELILFKEKCDHQKLDKLKLEERLKEFFEEKKTLNNELREMKDTVEKVGNKYKTISEEKASLQSQNEQFNEMFRKIKDEMEELKRQKNLLCEELKCIKIVKESSEAEIVVALKEDNLQLGMQIEEKSKKLSEIEREKALISTDKDKILAKIETLKSEKRDYEKTLEREIREKNEFRSQVTNIIQEIGRLEEQLREVRNSHALIQTEKQKLEQKISRIQIQHEEAKMHDKDQTLKWQTMMKELERKLQEMQFENTQLSEQNCLLQENSRRSPDENEDSKMTELNERIRTLSEDHATLFDMKERLEHQYRSLQDENETKEKEKLCLMEDLKSIQHEVQHTKAKLAHLESEKLNLTECCDNLRVVVDNIKTENENMIVTKDELQKSCENITSEFNKINVIKQRFEQEMETMKKDNKTLKKSLTDVENLLKQSLTEKLSLTESLHRNATDIEKKMENERIRDEKIQDLNRLIMEKETELQTLRDIENAISSTNQELERLNKDLLAKINDLQREYQRIQAENITLASQRHDITLKLTKIEDEMNSGREKILEMKSSNEAHVKELQVDKARLEADFENLKDDFSKQSLCLKTLSEEKALLIARIETISTKTVSDAENCEKAKNSDRIEALTSEIDKLKVINRELLVNQEIFEKSRCKEILDLSQEIENLTENSKEYSQATFEINKNNDSNDELLKLKTEKEALETKLKKIMEEVREVSNKSLFLEQKVENFLILEQNLERMKVSNEKLSRQLDETLVSMHLSGDGIQANTEFEYLRNILFQYLSGHVNANGTTLVKVIAAVLKFTPQQTNLVIEKEVQRRTLLGSINNFL